MNAHLNSVMAWMFAAPQRTKTILMIIVLVAMVAMMVLPTAIGFAGPMDGGPDATPLMVLGGGL